MVKEELQMEGVVVEVVLLLQYVVMEEEEGEEYLNLPQVEVVVEEVFQKLALEGEVVFQMMALEVVVVFQSLKEEVVVVECFQKLVVTEVVEEVIQK